MNIDLKFDRFKFGVFHNPTQGIEIKKDNNILSNIILGFQDPQSLMINLRSKTQYYI